MQIPILYEPVDGKTYSLFGKNNSTLVYYQLIGELADRVLERCSNPKFVLQTIQNYSRKKRLLRKLTFEKDDTGLISFIIHLLNASLADYTLKADIHLQNLPFYKFCDRRLSTTREQYHLYMLEVELTNRLFINQFINADRKIALLPYCLRDFSADCKSKPDDFDYQCKHCSKNCYQNYISRLLKIHNVDAYIWMGANIKELAKKVAKSHRTLSVLGIACIPELVGGMRSCQKNKIPVVGIPLDANRCIRWMGKFHKNSINLEQLELLLTTNKNRK